MKACRPRRSGSWSRKPRMPCMRKPSRPSNWARESLPERGEKQIMASVSEVSRPIGIARSRRSFLRRALGRQEFWRGCVAIVVFLILWEIGSRSGEWFGYTLPHVGLLPSPSDVAVAWSEVLMTWGYCESWDQSFTRVLTGFLAAPIIG